MKPVTTAQKKTLLSRARAVRARAYAPYSKFQVGAAVLDEKGRVHTGTNIENASYGLTVCAERHAVAAAVAAGAKQVRAVAVITPTSPPGSPCGACRQVLAEFALPEAPVLLASPTGPADETTMGELLPRSFKLAG